MAGLLGAIYCGARLGVNDTLLITGLFAVALFPAAGLLAFIPALVAIGMHKFASSKESWL